MSGFGLKLKSENGYRSHGTGLKIAIDFIDRV